MNDRAARILLLILALTSSGFGQGASSLVEWDTIMSPSKDLSFSCPSNQYLIDNEDDRFAIHCGNGHLTIDVSMVRTGAGKENFRNEISFLNDEEKKKSTFFQTGDFLGRQVDSQGEIEGKKYFSIQLQLASSKGRYSIYASSEREVDSQFNGFVHSIRLGGEPLFVANGNILKIANTFVVSDLKTTDVVLQALKVSDSKQQKLDRSAITAADKVNLDLVFSRKLIMLRKSRATYTDGARSNHVQGTVVLSVTFLATGIVGPIKLVSSLDKGLDNEAFKAARKIKFLPAEVDGKPVDAIRRVEYSFKIY